MSPASRASSRVRRTPVSRRAAARTCCRQRVLPRPSSAVEHVPVELRRPAHGLAGVVDDEVEPVAGRAQVRAKRLDARRVAQVEAEDLQPVAPLVEVRLLRVAVRRVARESRRDDQLRARAQQLDPRLVADLHAPAGEQRDAARQVGGLRALAVVEVGARRAQLVVERMDVAVVLLADVAVLRLDHLAELGIVVHVGLLELRRREDVRRREHRLLAQHPDPGLREHALVALELRRLLLALHRLAPLAPGDEVGIEDVPGRREQPGPLLLRQRREQAAVANDRLQQLRGCLQLLGDFVGDAILRADRHGPQGTSGACAFGRRCRCCPSAQTGRVETDMPESPNCLPWPRRVARRPTSPR